MTVCGGDKAVVYKGDRPYIFVSYAHDDKAFVLPIVEALDEAGYRIWFDEGIERASEWPANIAKHINSCSRFLAFVSHASVLSAYCRREILFAINHEKEMLVAYVDDVGLDQIKPGLELLLGEIQAKHRCVCETDEEFVESVLSAEILEPCLREDFLRRRKVRQKAIDMAHAALSSDDENVDELREALIVLQALPEVDRDKVVARYILRVEGRLAWLEAENIRREREKRERREAEETARTEKAIKVAKSALTYAIENRKDALVAIIEDADPVEMNRDFMTHIEKNRLRLRQKIDIGKGIVKDAFEARRLEAKKHSDNQGRREAKSEAIKAAKSALICSGDDEEGMRNALIALRASGC